MCKDQALTWIEELSSSTELDVRCGKTAISLSISQAAVFWGVNEIANQLFSEKYQGKRLSRNWEEETSTAFFLAHTSLDTSVSADFEKQFTTIFSKLKNKQQRHLSAYFTNWIQENELAEAIMECHWEGINKVRVSQTQVVVGEVLGNPLSLLFEKSNDMSGEVKYSKCNSSALCTVYLKALAGELHNLIGGKHQRAVAVSPKLFSEVMLLFALLQGNSERIHHVIQVYQIDALELSSLSWMLDALSSLTLSAIGLATLDKGLYYLFAKECPERVKRLELPHLLMLLALGLPESLKYITSVGCYGENLWEYIWETSRKEDHRTLYLYFRNKSKTSEEFISHEILEKKFLAFIVEKARYFAIRYLQEHANEQIKNTITELLLEKIKAKHGKELEYILNQDVINPLKVVKQLFSNPMIDVNKQEVSDKLIALDRYAKIYGPFGPEEQEACFQYVDSIMSQIRGLRGSPHGKIQLIDSILGKLFYLKQYPSLLNAITKEHKKKVIESVLSTIVEYTHQMAFIEKARLEIACQTHPDDIMLKARLDIYSDTCTQVQLAVGTFRESFSLAAGACLLWALTDDVFLRQQFYLGILKLGSSHLAYQSLMTLHAAKQTYFKSGLVSSDEQDREWRLFKHLIEVSNNAKIETNASSLRVTM